MTDFGLHGRLGAEAFLTGDPPMTMVPYLAQTAANLGIPNAFADFSTLLAQYFRTNKTAIIQNDNPSRSAAQTSTCVTISRMTALRRWAL